MSGQQAPRETGWLKLSEITWERQQKMPMRLTHSKDFSRAGIFPLKKCTALAANHLKTAINHAKYFIRIGD